MLILPTHKKDFEPTSIFTCSEESSLLQPFYPPQSAVRSSACTLNALATTVTEAAPQTGSRIGWTVASGRGSAQPPRRLMCASCPVPSFLYLKTQSAELHRDVVRAVQLPSLLTIRVE